jgi:small subunit ribosomal protein S1
MTSTETTEQPMASADGNANATPPTTAAEEQPPKAETTTVHADTAEAHATHAEAHATNGEGGEREESADDEGEGDDSGEGEEAPAVAADGTPAPNGEKRKRKRRRRKKKPGDAAAGGAPGAPGEEGAAQADGQASDDPNKAPNVARKKKAPRPDRERPAFNVSDVVFGKVIEITDDAIFVDLAGKAKAIFDRRELELPDEPPPGVDDPHSDLYEDRAEAEPVAEGAAEAAAEAAPEAGASTNVEAPAAEAPVAEAAPAAETPAEAAPAAEAISTNVEEAPAEPAAPTNPIWPAVTLAVGEQFVAAIHNDGGRGGLVVLTRHPRRVKHTKLVVGGAFKEKGEVLGLVTGVIKGGVEVDVDGLRAFAPGSHMDVRLGVDLSGLVGKRLLFHVTQFAKNGRDVVLSRRAFLELEAKALREEALKKLEIGAVVDGIVRSVVQFGAFVDVGGIEGLVPLSEMSHNRGDGPHDVFKVGQTTPVKILKVDDRGKIWLSRRAATPDPWHEVAKKYPTGSKHTGKIARLQPFGAFVELEPGIDGLIHTSDLSIKVIEHPNEVVKEGDSIDVVVAHLDVGAHRIALHPAPTGDVANEPHQRVVIHKPVKVAVVAHEPGGLVVRVLGSTGRHARGFITGAGTGTPRGSDLRKGFPVGTILEAKVVEIDPRRGEVKLSIKALSEDTERSAYRSYRDQVTKEAKFGTFADLLAKKNASK